MKRWLCRFGCHDWHQYRKEVFAQDKDTLNLQLNCFIGLFISLALSGITYDSKIFGFLTPLLVGAAVGALLILLVTSYITGIFGDSRTRWDGICLRCERPHLGLSRHELRCKAREQRLAEQVAQDAEHQELRDMRAQQLRSAFDAKRLEKLDQEVDNA